MKILYVGTLNPIGLGRNYIRAFEMLGHSVDSFDPNLLVSPNPMTRMVIRFRKAPMESRLGESERALVNLCERKQFDLVFVMAENFLSGKWMEEVRQLPQPAPLFVYHSHDNNFSPGILKPEAFWKTLSQYDFAFTTKSQNVAQYRALGQKHSYFLASAFEPSVHHPILQKKSRYRVNEFSVSFIGTYDRSRDRFVNAIRTDLLRIWGHGWKRFPNYRNYKQQIIPTAIYHHDFSDVVSHTRVNLGLLREEAQDLHTTRTFEIPACGGLQLAPRNQEILSFFDEDKEIVCFETVLEMHDKAQFLLRNESVRKKIALAGYERCQRGKHTYLDRSQELLEVVQREAGLMQSRRAA